MAFPLNTLEAAVVQDIVLPSGEDVYHVTYGVKLTAGTVAGDLQTVCNNLNTLFDTELMGAMSSGYSQGTTKLNAMIAGTEFVRITPGGTAGGGGPDSVPPNCALLVRKLTGVAGHAGVGSIYLPGFVAPDEINNTGHLLGPDLTAKQALFTSWLAAIVALANVDGMALLHRSTGAAADLVTGLVVQSKLATQHRRFNSR